jgi:hypothetical protein
MNWNIISLVVNPIEGMLTNVVTIANWSCTQTQTVNNTTYTAMVANSTILPTPTEGFTPYNELTENQVLNWVWASGVNKSEVELTVSNDLQHQINTIPALPWA